MKFNKPTNEKEISLPTRVFVTHTLYIFKLLNLKLILPIEINLI